MNYPKLEYLLLFAECFDLSSMNLFEFNIYCNHYQVLLSIKRHKFVKLSLVKEKKIMHIRKA